MSSKLIHVVKEWYPEECFTRNGTTVEISRCVVRVAGVVGHRARSVNLTFPTDDDAYQAYLGIERNRGIGDFHSILYTLRFDP